MGNSCKSLRRNDESLEREKQNLKIDALTAKVVLQEKLLNIERSRVEALRWELLISKDVGVDRQEKVIEVIHQKIFKQLGHGLFQAGDWEDKKILLRSFAPILLQNFSDRDSFEGDARNLYPSQPLESLTVDSIAILIETKAPGLRKDYIRTVLGWYADSSSGVVDTRKLWDECEDPEALGCYAKKMKALMNEALIRLQQVTLEQEEEGEKALAIAEATGNRLLRGVSPISFEGDDAEVPETTEREEQTNEEASERLDAISTSPLIAGSEEKKS